MIEQELEIIRMQEAIQKYFRENSGLGEYPGAVLCGERVILILIGGMADYEAWRDTRKASCDFLQPSEGTWSHDALSREAFETLLCRRWHRWRNGRAFPWFIFLRGEDGKPGGLIGEIQVFDITKERYPAATIGYWIGKPYARQGYMTEAGTLACNFAFGELGLRRLEAKPAWDNVASRGVLTKLGFKEEFVTPTEIYYSKVSQ